MRYKLITTDWLAANLHRLGGAGVPVIVRFKAHPEGESKGLLVTGYRGTALYVLHDVFGWCGGTPDTGLRPPFTHSWNIGRVQALLDDFDRECRRMGAFVELRVVQSAGCPWES